MLFLTRLKNQPSSPRLQGIPDQETRARLEEVTGKSGGPKGTRSERNEAHISRCRWYQPLVRLPPSVWRGTDPHHDDLPPVLPSQDMSPHVGGNTPSLADYEVSKSSFERQGVIMSRVFDIVSATTLLNILPSPLAYSKKAKINCAASDHTCGHHH